MDYKELKQKFRDLKQTSPKETLTAHIIFTEDSFANPYSLLSRTYRFSSDNKAFRPNLGGYVWGQSMKVIAYIHSLKDHRNNRHVLGAAEIIKQIGDNFEVNDVQCTAIFNCFTGTYYVDNVYGIRREDTHA